MSDDILNQLEISAAAMARGITPPAIGSDPLHYLNGQAAAEIRRIRGHVAELDGPERDALRAVLAKGRAA